MTGARIASLCYASHAAASALLVPPAVGVLSWPPLAVDKHCPRHERWGEGKRQQPVSGNRITRHVSSHSPAHPQHRRSHHYSGSCPAVARGRPRTTTRLSLYAIYAAYAAYAAYAIYVSTVPQFSAALPVRSSPFAAKRGQR